MMVKISGHLEGVKFGHGLGCRLKNHNYAVKRAETFKTGENTCAWHCDDAVEAACQLDQSAQS